MYGQVRLESSDLEAAAALLGVALVAEMPIRLTGTLELASLGSRATDGCWSLVSDAGQLGSAAAASERAVGSLRIGVLRGPCYVALRELVGAEQPHLAGLVLCSEAGRALDRRDVEDIAGLPVLATVDVTPSVARTLDAGLAATRLARMREFAQVRRWLTSFVSGPSCGPDRGAPRPVASRSEPVEKTCTDWHLPPRRKVRGPVRATPMSSYVRHYRGSTEFFCLPGAWFTPGSVSAATMNPDRRRQPRWALLMWPLGLAKRWWHRS
jgi:hypothetical protein